MRLIETHKLKGEEMKFKSNKIKIIEHFEDTVEFRI